MNILLVLIPVTLLVVGIAVALFFWAVSHQQFEDLDTPAILPLIEDQLAGSDSIIRPDSSSLDESRCHDTDENQDQR